MTDSHISTVASRLALTNVKRSFESESLCVMFDVFVDGALIGHNLEWTDEDGDVVLADRNNNINPEMIQEIETALDDEKMGFDVCYDAFFNLLNEAVKNLPIRIEYMSEAQKADERWWMLAVHKGEAEFGWGDYHEARKWEERRCNGILDETRMPKLRLVTPPEVEQFDLESQAVGVNIADELAAAA